MVTIKVNGTSLSSMSRRDAFLGLARGGRINRTKFGCGIAQCGRCTVHINGSGPLLRTPIGHHRRCRDHTIEGVSADSRHPVQQAWLAEEVPQCGYCQSGQIMATVRIQDQSNPTDADIDANLTNICRCGLERLRARRSSARPLRDEIWRENSHDDHASNLPPQFIATLAHRRPGFCARHRTGGSADAATLSVRPGRRPFRTQARSTPVVVTIPTTA